MAHQAPAAKGFRLGMQGRTVSGLVIVYTGGGKGKTTAALGLALRAVGHGRRIRMIQFIKGSWHYGEMTSSSRLAPELEVVAVGRGFVGILDDTSTPEQHRRVAAEAMSMARRDVSSGEYDIVILDEINYAVKLGLVDEEAVLEALGSRHADVDVVLTGNHARPAVLDAADLVTEMREVKHPFRKGMRAKEGIDY